MWNKVEYNKVDDSGRGHLEMVREVTLEENQPYTIIDVADPSCLAAPYQNSTISKSAWLRYPSKATNKQIERLTFKNS